MTAAEHQMGPATGMDRAGPLVAFDFDGTLTVKDSFTAFLRWRSGARRYYAAMASLAPAVATYVTDRDRTRLKSALIRALLTGAPRATLEADAAEFAAKAAPLLFRPDALKAWRRHRAAGARVMIVTASPDIVVAPFARGLGADLLLGSRLLYDAHDRVGPGLDGVNCRGPEKERRLREVIGPEARLEAAYGDTDGDIELLAMADDGYMKLFTGKPTAAVGTP